MYVKATENDEATIAEYRLGREVYKDVVMHLVYELHVRACDRCMFRCRGESDHTCVVPPSNADELILSVSADPLEFQESLARRCTREKILLRRPQDVYRFIHRRFKEDIEREVVAEVNARYMRHVRG